MPISAGAAQFSSSEIGNILTDATSSWDKRIAADLTAEMEIHLGDRVSTIPEMRRMLGVKGYQGLHRRIVEDIDGKSGHDALRAMAYAMRSFALERPGLSAATFRSPATDSPEWRQALAELTGTVLGVFAQVGLEGVPAQQALRILRSLVRGIVLSEMAASFSEPLDYKTSYELGIEMFILGLAAFKGRPEPSGL